MLEPMERLIAVLARLPGLGRRSAERIALRLVRDRSRGLGRELVAALQELDEHMRYCTRCGGLTTTAADPCRLCTDPRREDALLCVVEDAADLFQIENSGSFRGRYHVLGGRLSPMRGEGPSTLRVESLVQRLREGAVREVILALNTEVESDATVAFLAEQLKPLGVRVTRLAYGLPAGSGIAYSDAVTLSHALEGRQTL